jgi:hypothetical protein
MPPRRSARRKSIERAGHTLQRQQATEQAPKEMTSDPLFGAGTEKSPASSSGIGARMNHLQRTLGNQATLKITQNASGHPAQIQRLMMDETYLYDSVKPHDEKVDGFDPQGQGRGRIEELQTQPYWKSLVRRVRVYDEFTKANRYTRDRAREAQSLLMPIERDMALVNMFIFDSGKMAQIAYNFAENGMDDVAQDKKALADLAAGRGGMPENALSLKDALFFVRSGTAYGDVLQEDDLAPDTEGGEAGSPVEFGGGNVSVPTGLTYDVGGNNERRVFKGDEKKPGVQDQGTKLDWYNAQTALRSMATARVQALIKQKMEEAGQEFTSLIGQFDFAMYKGQLGTAASLASGSEARAMTRDDRNALAGSVDFNVDLTDITLQRQLANLQLFDMLTGQSDRNPGNIMIAQDEDRETKVTGIDQDFSFSEQTDLGDVIGKAAMPTFIDRYFAEAVMALNLNEYKAALKGLPKTSVDAAISRFNSAQKILGEMAAANQLIVAPGDTNYPNARNWGQITPDDYRYNSFTYKPSDYMGRLRNMTTQSRANVKQALIRDPSLAPEQVTKGGQEVWVIKTGPYDSVRARNENGSDLDALIVSVKLEIEREARQRRQQRQQQTNPRGLMLGGGRGRGNN